MRHPFSRKSQNSKVKSQNWERQKDKPVSNADLFLVQTGGHMGPPLHFLPNSSTIQQINTAFLDYDYRFAEYEYDLEAFYFYRYQAIIAVQQSKKLVKTFSASA